MSRPPAGIAKGLRDHAYAVDVVRDGEVASKQLAAAEYDAVSKLRRPLVAQAFRPAFTAAGQP